MTPVPIDLPVRPSEAAAVAELIYEQLGERRLTADARSRLAGRTATLGLRTIVPYFGSLESDPVHPATYYLAVDGLAGGTPVPLLLHMAPASAPASGLFPSPLLIARMRPAAGREIVVNAIGFGPEHEQAIAAYTMEIGRAFLPRAQGATPLVWVDPQGDALAAAKAMTGFRTMLKTSGHNFAGLRCQPRPEAAWAMVWAAIRAGYRDGYSLACPFAPEIAKIASCFRVEPGGAEHAVHLLRSVRAGIPFDLELDLRSGGGAGQILDRLKALGATPQFLLGSESAAASQALPAIEIHPGTVEQARQTRGQHPGPCAFIVRWDGQEPAIADLLEALR